ncbi:MAG: PKD domain-containing protein [Candidatus Limnocylindrales bacterium]
MLRHRRQRLAALAGAFLIAVSTAGTAVAAAQTRTIGLAYAGDAAPAYAFDVKGYCDACIPDAFQVILGRGSWAYGATTTATVDDIHWAAGTSTALLYDDSLLRQGQTLGLSDVLTTTGGTIVAHGTLKGAAGLINDPTGGSNFGPSGTSQNIDRTATWTITGCAMPLPGESPRTCVSNTQDMELASRAIASNLVATLKAVLSVQLRLEIQVSSDGIIVARSLTVVGGSGSQDRTMTFVGSSPSTLADPIALSCTQPSGSDVAYALTAQSYAPVTEIAGRGTLHAEAVLVPLLIGPDIPVFGDDITSIVAPSSAFGITLDGNGGAATLGVLAKNNIPPVADSGGGGGHAYIGDQGTPITFNSASTSVCGPPSIRWDFSDGGVAFGDHPQHTFQGSGVYSGLMTATDITGLTATQAFSIGVANLAPVVDAGQDTSAAWGRPVAFNGQAVDPGKDDQSTLTYVWRFGDGTPSATSGPSVIHAYATPATYHAMFTACDRNGLCESDTRDVVVRARDISVGNLGDTAATYDTGAHLQASLVDEFGQIVNGRTVTFTVDGNAAGSAVTNSSGLGSTAWTPAIAAGLYATSATFAGDTLYTSKTGSGSVSIARKATTTTYTGTLTGGANKTITLSAVLVDATGTPLGGRTIAFKLGAQTTTAITGPSGVASIQLKLAQKNGTYPLAATWTPVGADAVRYLGSAASASFKLQAK